MNPDRLPVQVGGGREDTFERVSRRVHADLALWLRLSQSGQAYG